jgi:hypothetical protein
MKERIPMILGCLFLAWLFSNTTEPVSTLPTDGLVEQVATVKDSLTVQAGETARRSKSGEWEVVKDPLTVPVVKQSLTTDHIADASKKVDHIGNATKKVEAKKEIVIFTRANCPPCDRWKRIEQPKFERAGWKVAYCDRHDFAITPHFLIEENGKQYENKGYLPFDKIDEVVK